MMCIAVGCSDDNGSIDPFARCDPDQAAQACVLGGGCGFVQDGTTTLSYCTGEIAPDVGGLCAGTQGLTVALNTNTQCLPRCLSSAMCRDLDPAWKSCVAVGMLPELAPGFTYGSTEQVCWIK
jgi:hypothetical protein